MILMAILAAGMSGDRSFLPKLPEPKPEGYGVHLSKAERRSLSWREQQALRAERAR